MRAVFFNICDIIKLFFCDLFSKKLLFSPYFFKNASLGLSFVWPQKNPLTSQRTRAKRLFSRHQSNIMDILYHIPFIIPLSCLTTNGYSGCHDWTTVYAVRLMAQTPKSIIIYFNYALSYIPARFFSRLLSAFRDLYLSVKVSENSLLCCSIVSSFSMMVFIFSNAQRSTIHWSLLMIPYNVV